MDLLTEIDLLLAVVETGSLLAAARRLGRSASSISRALDGLERRVGATLLLRSTRGVQLTAEGRAFRVHAEAVADAAARAVESVRPAEPDGTLTVSASTALGLTWLNPLVFAFLKRWPRVRVALRLEDRLIDLIGDGVDVAVRAGGAPADHEGLIAFRLGAMPRVLVAAPGVAMVDAPDDLRRCDLVTSNRSGVTAWTFRRGAEVVRVERPARLAASGLLAVRDAARAGLGVAVLSEPVARDDLATQRLERLLPTWEIAPAPVWAIYRRELRRSRVVAAFVEHLRAASPPDAPPKTMAP
jgi:DNA-binding transcriptional LysR family regulator